MTVTQHGMRQSSSLSTPGIKRRYLVQAPFLAKDILVYLEFYGPVREFNISQGYFSKDRTADQIVLRKEHFAKDQLPTCWKIRMKQGDREEREVISSEAFLTQWNSSVRVSFFMTSYVSQHNGIEIRYDVFRECLRDYSRVEVRFDTLQESQLFVPPEWFGIEVTDDESHRDYNLAAHGIPTGEKIATLAMAS